MRYEEYLRQLLLWALLGATTIAMMMMLHGCKTKYVSVPEYHKEYINRTDSFFHTDTIKEKEWMTIREVDSAQLAELGVYLKNIKNAYLIERNKDKERNHVTLKANRDTVIKTDSVRVPYPVERKLGKWEQVKLEVGGWAIGGMMAVVIAGTVYLVRWLKNKYARVC